MKLIKSMNSSIKEDLRKIIEIMQDEEEYQREISENLMLEHDPSEIKRLKELHKDSCERWDNYHEHFVKYNEMIKSGIKISPESWLAFGGTIAQILLILNYERFGNISSKAMQFITKKRV